MSRIVPVTLISLPQIRSMRGKNVRDATSSDKLTFVVSIGKVNLLNSHFCTGTLVSRKIVLTVEHCIVGQNKDDVEITIGSTDLREGTRYRVAWWTTFDQWYYRTPVIEETTDEIAVVALTESVNGTEIKPASILYTGVSSLHCSRVRMAGWGLVEDGTRPTILKTGVVKVVPLRECLERAKILKGTTYRIPEDYFCSKADPWLLVGPGDSGAPVLDRGNQLVAITTGPCPLLDEYSQEFQNCNPRCNLMNLHLHLLRYKKFIKAAILDAEY